MDESLREKLISRDLFVNQVRKWEDLPTDCLVNIFQRVDTESLIEYLPFVCKSWYKASLDPQCWKISTEIRHHDQMNILPKCIGLRGRSCLQSMVVVERHLRCAELKSLVTKCYFEDELKCISKQMYKLKDLESLSLLYNGCHVVEFLAEIHTHCKNFVSLTLRDEINTEVASAIVTFVPNIKHLILRLCSISREDLILILSGCKELELLDVTDCIGFYSGDDEILTMSSHIKNFMPKDSYMKEEEDYGPDSCYNVDYGSDSCYDNYYNYMSDESHELEGLDYSYYDYFCQMSNSEAAYVLAEYPL